MDEQSAEHQAKAFTSKQRTVALIIVAFAFIMDLLDSTIVNIAIPSIQANLHASYATIQWLVAGYSLTFALLLITGGRMGDVFGYKKVFLTGIGGFTVASLLSGIAPNSSFLIVARLLQGSMAALMVPQVMSLMQVMYKPHERNSVMGIFGMLGGLAASLGPIVGGLLIKANLFGWDWRPIFLINLPVGIGAFIAACYFLPKGRSTHPLKMDLVGTGLVVIALSLLIFPLIEGRDLGWPAWSFAMLFATIPAMALFGWYEQRKMKRDGSALIVPSLFKIRSFVNGLTLNILLECVMIGFFLTFTLLLQIGIGFSVIKAALTGVPIAIGIGLSIAAIGQKLMPKLGRYIFILGAAILSAGVLSIGWIVNRYGITTHPWQLLASLFVTGIGIGTIMTPMFSIALQDVDTQHAGAASGILNAIQQVGAAIGIAIIGVIFFGQLNHNALNAFHKTEPALRQQLTALHVPSAAQDNLVIAARDCFYDRSTQKDSSQTPASCQMFNAGESSDAAAQAIGNTIATTAKTANANNFAHAYKATLIFTMSVLVVICGLSFLLPRHFRVLQETI